MLCITKLAKLIIPHDEVVWDFSIVWISLPRLAIYIFSSCPEARRPASIELARCSSGTSPSWELFFEILFRHSKCCKYYQCRTHIICIWIFETSICASYRFIPLLRFIEGKIDHSEISTRISKIVPRVWYDLCSG